jgi:hypothetical protein
MNFANSEICGRRLRLITCAAAFGDPLIAGFHGLRSQPQRRLRNFSHNVRLGD